MRRPARERPASERLLVAVGAVQAIALATFWALAFVNVPTFLDHVLIYVLAPFVCVLALVGLVTLWRPLRGRAGGGAIRAAVTVEILCFGTAALVAVVPVFLIFTPGYGANFDYPSKPPVPPGATVIAQAKGWDDDDPMRGRELVMELGDDSPAELLNFYRERFPSSSGWRQGTPDPDMGGGHLLCLVRHSDKSFDEYVEIYPYDREFKSAGPRRYLASVSRLMPERGERTVNRCGVAGGWFPMDL